MSHNIVFKMFGDIAYGVGFVVGFGKAMLHN